MIQDWYQITYDAVLGFWKGFLNFIPNFIIAVIVFVIGWLIAGLIGKVISQILIRLKFNRIFEKADWREALEKAEIKVNPAEFIGAICKWSLVIVSLLISVEILGFTQFAILLNRLISWLPNLVIAIVIFIVAVIVADLLDKIIRASVKKIGVRYVGVVGLIVRWSIWVFAILAILDQLKIEAASWVMDLLKIVLAGIVIAIAIAFGLGGKDAAARLIDDLTKKVSEK